MGRLGDGLGKRDGRIDPVAVHGRIYIAPLVAGYRVPVNKLFWYRIG